MEKIYKIQATTNGWIASRDPMFNGKCEVTLEGGLTLKEAQRRLLDLFNRMYEGEYYAHNWGMAVLLTRDRVFSASPTYADGTRMFDYDSRRFSIEEEEVCND